MRPAPVAAPRPAGPPSRPAGAPQPARPNTRLRAPRDRRAP